MTATPEKTRQTPSLLDKIGLSARDVIMLIFILTNAALIIAGHQQLDSRILTVQQVAAQTARTCQEVVAVP